MAVSTAVKWKINKLIKHPQQDTVFGDISDAELTALAADIKANGLQHPIEILPDGTIVAGHQRVRAAVLLGRKEIDAVVRTDLAKAGEAAVETHFINDNLRRRHLSPLGLARCVKRLVEIETFARDNTLHCLNKDKLREIIGERLGLSGRSVSRYLLVLDAPAAVQQAFDRGEISLTNAGKMAMLDDDGKTFLRQSIAFGVPIKEAVAELLGRSRRTTAKPVAFRKVFLALEREMPAIRRELGTLTTIKLGTSKPIIEAFVKLLADVLKKSVA
jgi:ParB/RepB/Spo0J family partition protein